MLFRPERFGFFFLFKVFTYKGRKEKSRGNRKETLSRVLTQSLMAVSENFVRAKIFHSQLPLTGTHLPPSHF